MRGVYTAELKTASLASAKPLILLTAATNKPLEIISAHAGNTGSNVTNQQVELAIARVTTLGSPTGTAITPNPEEVNDQASSATVTGIADANGTDVTTKGVKLDHQGCSSLAGYQFAPVPEERPLVAGGASVVFYFVAAPGVAYDCVYQIKYREIG